MGDKEIEFAVRINRLMAEMKERLDELTTTQYEKSLYRFQWWLI